MRKRLEIGNGIEMIMKSDNEIEWTIWFRNRKTKKKVGHKHIVTAFTLWTLLDLIQKDKLKQRKRQHRNRIRRVP